ncbi:MAG: carboxypeptidase regulatory-like domain-containing protein [Bryobacteraceae bacterium]
MSQRLFLCAALLSLSIPVFGQRNTASVSGTTTDPTGAVVPGAQVTAIQTSTGTTSRTQSDANGFYQLLNLPPGSYSIRVEHSGFQAYVQDGIVLQVDQSATINVALKVGSQAESVTVTEEPPLVDVRTQTLTTSITPQMARELPLNGRNVLQLMALAPDVSPGGSRCFGQGASRPESKITFVSASGARSNETAFYLDGGINEDPYTEIANVFPNPDAIQEFSVQTNSYSAKFGGRGGGVVNAATRGGSNDFHGSAFEFLRNHTLNARNFFASSDDGLKRNQYGFSLGGPVQKNKTFFFASWQGTKVRSVPTQNVQVTPTAAQLSGDFSAIGTQLVDPSTGAPFPGNQIPTSRFDPIAVKVLNSVPIGAPGTGLSFYSTFTRTDDNQWVGRVDHNFGEKFRISARYLYDRLEQPGSIINNNILSVTDNAYWQSQNVTFNANYLPKPNFVGSLTLTYNRVVNIQLGPKNLPGWVDLGVNVADEVGGAGNAGGPGFYLNVDGYFSANWDPLYRVPRAEYDLSNNWTYIRGAHTIEFGGEIIREQNILAQVFLSQGSFNFASQLSGDNLLDFLLGRPSDFQQFSPTYESLYRTLPALYFNDSWKATRRLTVNLGVRWEPWKMFHEQANQISIFTIGAATAGIHSTVYPNLPPGELVPGDPGVRNTAVPTYNHIFDPRVGLAWDVFGNGRTSVRAGFGIYHDMINVNSNNDTISAPPWALSVDIPFPASLQNPYQGHVVPFPAFRPFAHDQTFAFPFFGNEFDPSMAFPVIQQWNLAIEKQLPAGFMFRAAYEGMESYHLFGGVEQNQAVYIPGQSTFENVQDRRPMGQYYTSNSINTATGTASFNGLTLTMEKRATKGLTFTAGFRWAKMLDEMNGAGTSMGQSDYTSNNPKIDRGLSSVDVDKQFIGSYVWQLPTWKSLGFFGRNVIGGWESSGVLTLRHGFPFSVLSGLDYSYSGNGIDRADLIGDPSLSGGRSKAAQLAEWFNTAAFTFNAAGTFGTSGRDILRAPGVANLDFALTKSFPLHIGPFRETQKIDFRAEAFNIFNHANFGRPDRTLTHSTFGEILSAADPRILQFALRFSF